MATVSVLLVEDEAETREYLAEAIRAEPRLRLSGAVAKFDAALRALQEETPDVLLVDLGLPDGDGTELIRRACAEGSKTSAMVITVFGDERHVIRAIEAGATGYLLKDAAMDKVARSIIDLVNGGSPISPAIARHLLKRFRTPSPDPLSSEEDAIVLTEREQQVLELVVKGFSFKEAAEGLSISVHTVVTHIQHIYRKLSVRSRGEAVYEALQQGLVDPREH